eukprot:gene19553-21485_t
MDEEFKSFLLKAPLKKTSSPAKCSFDYYLESLKDDQRLETLKEDGDPFQKHRRDGQARRSLFPFNISGIDDINIDSENEDYGDGNENFFSEGLDESLLSDFANEISFEDAASSEEDSLKHCALKTDTLKLEDLLLKGKRAEASKIQAERMENSLSTGLQKLEISETNTVQKFKSKPKPVRKQYNNTPKQAAVRKSTCYNCGFDFPHTTGPCPARGKTCGSCKRKNHFTRCCKSKTDGKTPKNSQRVRKIEATTKVSESSESSDDDYVFYMDGRNKKRKLEVSVKINQEHVSFFSTLAQASTLSTKLRGRK